ncbi:hypothetical protein SVAN01_06906 [Stagonosporopsis vannaccii]|nr:hypothetical protein SVAN01_06906 [Stagonosporopsis vannaccii]
MRARGDGQATHLHESRRDFREPSGNRFCPPETGATSKQCRTAGAEPYGGCRPTPRYHVGSSSPRTNRRDPSYRFSCHCVMLISIHPGSGSLFVVVLRRSDGFDVCEATPAATASVCKVSLRLSVVGSLAALAICSTVACSVPPGSSCSNVDNTAGSVRTILAQNASHRAAGPKFWNNLRDLSESDNFTLPDGLRRKSSIQLDLMHVSKLCSGKADGVSAQHTKRSLLTSRELQAVAPGHSCREAASILNGESFASAQRQKIHRECGPRPSQRFSVHVCSPLSAGQGAAVYESRTCQHRSFIKTNSGIQR